MTYDYSNEEVFCEETQAIEQAGFKFLFPHLVRIHGEHIRLGKYDERGDFLVPGPAAEIGGEKFTGIEVKTEKTFTGNFAWEHMSDIKKKRAGWANTLKCSLLYYTFLDTKWVGRIDFPKADASVREYERRFVFRRERPERNARQKNQTEFLVVPIDFALKEGWLEVLDFTNS